MKYITNSEQETFALGKELASKLKNLILLYGEMGAGKTAITKGICSYFGVDESEVCSPTFAIVNQYIGDGKDIFHFDAYKLCKADWHSQGFDEYVSSDSICIIEWAENLDETLFVNYSKIKIIGSGDESREIWVD